jgi:hypothetical protein
MKIIVAVPEKEKSFILSLDAFKMEEKPSGETCTQGLFHEVLETEVTMQSL